MNETPTDATKVPKWAMDAAKELAFKLGMWSGPNYKAYTIPMATIIAAAAPNEAEIRRDEMEKFCREICSHCKEGHKLSGEKHWWPAAQEWVYCHAKHHRARFAREHGGPTT